MKTGIFFEGPLDGFMAVELNDSDSTYTYVQYVNIFGDWVISRENKTAGEYRYCFSGNNTSYTIADAWAARAGLTYQYPSDAFSAFKVQG